MDIKRLKGIYEPKRESRVFKEDFLEGREVGDKVIYEYLKVLEKNTKKQACIDKLVLEPEKTHKQIASDLGITPKTISEWRKDPSFIMILNNLMWNSWSAKRNEILNKLYCNALEGDVGAGRAFLKYTASD